MLLQAYHDHHELSTLSEGVIAGSRFREFVLCIAVLCVLSHYLLSYPSILWRRCPVSDPQNDRHRPRACSPCCLFSSNLCSSMPHQTTAWWAGKWRLVNPLYDLMSGKSLGVFNSLIIISSLILIDQVAMWWLITDLVLDGLIASLSMGASHFYKVSSSSQYHYGLLQCKKENIDDSETLVP